MASEDDSGILQSILEWFGWGRPSVASIIHRGSPPQLDFDVWRMNNDGGDARKITSDGGYRWPTYCNGNIYAVRRNVLRQIDPASTQVEIPIDLGDEQLDSVIGCRKGKVGVLTDAGTVFLFDITSGERETLAENLQSTSDLLDASRTCDNQTVAVLGHLDLTDVYVRRHDERGKGNNLTQSISNPIKFDPAFSEDCKEIAFVASPEPPVSNSVAEGQTGSNNAGSAPRSVEKGPRGCSCQIIPSRQFSILHLIISILTS
ncbi:MAG: hypothetical protein GY866_07130 [Proteobacteria bacterium]|nr:hypothetical protein [Pseudomonadota bacterium]